MTQQPARITEGEMTKAKPRVDEGLTWSAEAGLDGPDSDEEPVLSVILPTLNEEQSIAHCIEDIREAFVRLGISGEIIVADSSTDQTPDIAREHGAIVVEPDGVGYGYAYRYAFEHARGEYIAMGDADSTYDFRELPTLFERAKDGADIAMGSRLEGDIQPGAMPALHRYVGNPILTRFLNAFYDAGVSDAHSGMRVFHRSVLAKLSLESDGMEFASEMVMDAAANGLNIVEEPITYRQRRGKATLRSFRDGWRHVKFMLVNAPGYLFSVPGAVLAALGLTLMALAFFQASVVGPGVRTPNFGVRTMIAGSLLTIVGYQVASMGVFATIAADPIRRPKDRVTTAIVDRLSLEIGATVGLVVFTFGAVYATYLTVRWITGGYEALPILAHDIAAFTAIVLGVQTVFGSFFMSAISS